MTPRRRTTLFAFLLALGSCGGRLEPAPDCRQEAAPVDLGAFCPSLEERCDELCTPAIATWLEEADDRLCPAAARALLDCLDAPHCDDVIECTVAWFDHVATPSG